MGVNTTIWYDTRQSSRGGLVTIADLVCVGPAFIDKLDKNNFYSVLHFEATYAKNAVLVKYSAGLLKCQLPLIQNSFTYSFLRILGSV